MFSLFSTSHTKHPQRKAELGFSLIELMVSIGIMVLVVGVIMVRQTSFNGAVLLRSQAYEIALTLRNLQLNAVSATADEEGGDFIFRGESYGAHFQVGDTFDGTFQIFKDATPPDGFDSGDELFGEQGRLDPRFRISAIEADGTSKNEISVVFTRPNFDAVFFGEAVDPSPLVVSNVRITVERRGSSGSGRDSVRIIEISAAGQIAVLTDD